MNPIIDKLIAGTIAAAIGGLLLVGFFSARNTLTIGSAQATEIPAPSEPAASVVAAPAHAQSVVFAGGCFWGVQAVFQHVKGVERAVSGYTGGSAATAHYAQVSTGTTGHAESVQVTFDPALVSYAKLMQIFFSVVHDPTQRDAQGPDHGSQYRSAIFTTTPEQLSATNAYIAQLQRSKAFASAITTQVSVSKPFYPAERYHQDYLTLNPQSAYIRYYDAPKLEALKQSYPALYRPQPVLVTAR